MISYSGVTKAMENASAWICVSDRDAEANSYKQGYQEPEVDGEKVTLTAPFDEGEYELRFYDGSSANKVNLAKRLTIDFVVK